MKFVCFCICSIFLSCLFCEFGVSFCSCLVSVIATFSSCGVFLLRFFYVHHACVCSILQCAARSLCCSACVPVGHCEEPLSKKKKWYRYWRWYWCVEKKMEKSRKQVRLHTRGKKTGKKNISDDVRNCDKMKLQPYFLPIYQSVCIQSWFTWIRVPPAPCSQKGQPPGFRHLLCSRTHRLIWSEI